MSGFEEFALRGFWLLVALGVVFAAGVILSQRVKDWIRGVPNELRAALRSREQSALTSLRSEQSKLIARVTGLVPATAAAAPEAKVSIGIDTQAKV